MVLVQDIQAALGEAMRAHQAGRLDEAMRAYGAVLQAFPASADGHHLYGLALHQRGDQRRAAISMRRALAVDRAQPDFHLNLALVAAASGSHAEAVAANRRALCLAPGDPPAHFNLGRTLDLACDSRAAAVAMRRSLAIDPTSILALIHLAVLQQNTGQLEPAAANARRVIAAAPDAPVAYNLLATLLRDAGLAAEPARFFRRTLAIAWDSSIQRNLLLVLHYLDDFDPQQVMREHRRWAERLGAERCERPDPDRRAGRRLSIGYLSGDLRYHAVGNNLIGLIENHDKTRVQVTMYSNVPQPDWITRRFQAAADRWRDIHSLNDAEVARRIAADRIDILVCCAGHVGENRLEVAAFKPAPIQVSLHDVTSSGLDTVDYWLTDAVLHPPDTREQFTETLYRLPCFYLHQPIEPAPDPGPLPEAASGRITFGSCNNPKKLSPRTLSTWASVLRAVPGSRLALWYFEAFQTRSLRDRLVAAFSGLGVDPERLLLSGSELGEKDQHLRFLRDVDIALDPLPFNGATTTFEQLWMGVPVITVAGDRFTARVGASMLSRVGLDHLVARSPEDMVGIAQRLAADRPQRERLRRELRSRLRASPLCNARAHAASVEAAYAAMWADAQM